MVGDEVGREENDGKDICGKKTAGKKCEKNIKLFTV